MQICVLGGGGEGEGRGGGEGAGEVDRRQVWHILMQYVDEVPTTMHIVGGGCQDNLLNQFAANAIGVKVAACPVEATGLGNIMVQMLADGAIADVTEGRAIVLNSSLVQTFEPTDQVVWAEAKAQFSMICK